MTKNLVQQLEKLWESSDTAPDVFEFLEQHLGSDAGEILSVLLADQSRRWKTSQPLKVEDYLDRIPVLQSDPEAKTKLNAGEFQARQSARTELNDADVTSEFPDVSGTLGGESGESIPADGEFELRTDVSWEHPSSSHIKGTPKQLGRYRLVRVLGEGAYGRVYLGFDQQLERQVAIKVPTPERFKKPEDAEDYLAEARTVARLNHPNIVPVYDMGRIEDGSIYVVSKFIEGCTLAERFKHDRPTHEEAAELLATVAQALEHAHQKGLIHRDVKPGNILLEESTNTPYVADFGLAISEDNYLKERRIAGTPAYMSPEQARGEGHRLDRRSDVFSVGMVLFELLTGKKPFRASTTNELMHKIIADEPLDPRELDHSIPAELERICLKAMSKRASDRYATAAELAEDLLHWKHDPQHEKNELQIVPKGLRSFDAGDAEFFLSLLPGPRNRNGLPESIEFWKKRIEEMDPDKTFCVGLIYGPSGCGKSSLVKAGLLPRLSKTVTTVYVEATPEETETRILRGLRKQIPELPQDLRLLQTLTLLRLGGQNRKVVIIVDQFEQWLHAFRAEDGTELVAALRQCDGERLQAIVMVRDDFAMAAARFMDAVDIPIVQGENFATVDLFDIDHARKVIIKFGQAFGKLPVHSDELTLEQQKFVTTVAYGLAQDGKVISVRLALFAEMVKGKSWVPVTLDEVGGTEGIGVNFLEETFASRTANPKHRLHQQAARDVLSELLPEIGSDIKGHMRSHAALLEASGYQSQPGKFNELLRILDGELRLITPTDPEGFQAGSGSNPSSKFFQLTHDYLVSPLRDWLTRKQIETRKGRAELKLAERAALWNAKPENRHLPSLLEWAKIRTLTDYKKTNEQRKLMECASRYYGIRFGIVAVALLALVFTGLTIRNSLNKNHLELVEQKRQEQSDAEATRIVEGLLQADSSQIKTIIEENLPDYRQWAEDDLSSAFANLPDNSNGKLHAALAILPGDDSVLPYLQEQLLTVSPYQFQHVSTLLNSYKYKLIPDYWKIAKDPRQDAGLRFQAACALASYDPANKHWQKMSFREFIASHLVSVLPSELLPWRNALSPVKDHLTAPLAAIYRGETKGEQVRSFATDTLADYLENDVEGLFDLLADANQKQFGAMFNKIIFHRQRAVELGNSEVTKPVPVDVGDEIKEAHAIRQANAAIMLLRLDAPDQIWPVLKHSTEPLARSYLVNWLIPRGGDPIAIINQYQLEKDVTIKRALLLSLGKFDESRLLENERDAFFETLLTEYRTDPDAGLHGALSWLLRKCGRAKQIAAIDKDLQQSEIELLEAKDDPRNWYVNGRGQTFVIVDAKKEFQMGSSVEATDHAPDEDLHTRKIGRRFAIATMEVTVANWREFNDSVGGFSPDQEQLQKFIRTEDSPMMAITWYEAAKYCNWLSQQEGIPVEEWCYETNEDDEYGPGMYAKEDFLECSGYRLPTEAEWEFASRDGVNSSHHYGSTAALMSEYAWHQANSNHHVHAVALLKPSDFGLFDIYGNAYEWCYDQYERYPTDSDSGEPAADDPETRDVSNEQRRILRGGSFRNRPPTARSASRVADSPSARVLNNGLRPVRTMN